MKVLVPVKRVIDYSTAVRVKPDGSSVVTDHVKMSMNPFDAIAVEEAVRLKEKKLVTEMTAISIGQDSVQETLRVALAMGADRAIHVKTNLTIEALAAAKIFKYFVDQESSNLVILGKQAIDTDNNQVGQMLAGLLNWAQATFISKIEVLENEWHVTREVDDGLEILKLKLPAIFTTDLRLNEPRYLSLPQIVKAKQKPIQTVDLTTLAIDVAPRVKILHVETPEKKRRNIQLNNAAELVQRLKQVDQIL